MAVKKKAKRAVKAVQFMSYGSDRIARLSDPDVRPKVRKKVKELTETPGAALKFLQEIGILTPTGRLTKRYGG